MEKEIKFRQPVFNNDGKFNEWHYWGLNIEQGCELANVGWLTFKLNITDPKQSQRFTGLQDEQGKDIYEGDICSNGVAKWEVIFHTGCFCGKRINGSDGTQNMHLALRAIKGKSIVGNIYEKPELLK